jgi:hypothetical protein
VRHTLLLRASTIAAVGPGERRVATRRLSVRATRPKGYSLLEFGAIREIVEVGCIFATRQLENWREAGRLEFLPQEAA